MMFEAMAFKFCPLHIKLSTSNFKLKKGLSSCDKPFFYAKTNPVIAMDPKVQGLLNGVALSVPAAPRQ